MTIIISNVLMSKNHNLIQKIPTEQNQARGYLPFLLASSLLLTACNTPSKSQQDSCVSPAESNIASVEAMLDNDRHDNKAAQSPAKLTTYDYVTEYQYLFNDITAGDGPTYTLPFSVYFEAAQQFGKKYDVDIEIPKDGIFLKEGRPLDSADLENKSAKRAMVSAIQSFGKQPVELIKWAGLKKIQFIDLPGNINGYVQARQKPNIYYVDPNIGFTPEVFRHELYHLVDAKACTDIRKDNAYKQLNPANIYKNKEAYISYTEIEDTAEIEQMMIDAMNPDAMQYTQYLDQIGSQVATINPYGESQPSEDKATIGAEILNPGPGGLYGQLTSQRYPILRAKFIYLLARLHAQRPEFAEYLIQSKDHEWR